ncbi:MAG: hypothetical protein KBH93_12725 [Anaerolineae bacterium]|nr:hypothetical protein [Anaerolineae bacterium]
MSMTGLTLPFSVTTQGDQTALGNRAGVYLSGSRGTKQRQAGVRAKVDSDSRQWAEQG